MALHLSIAADAPAPVDDDDPRLLELMAAFDRLDDLLDRLIAAKRATRDTPPVS